jgi:hypothetical protein
MASLQNIACLSIGRTGRKLQSCLTIFSGFLRNFPARCLLRRRVAPFAPEPAGFARIETEVAMEFAVNRFRLARNADDSYDSIRGELRAFPLFPKFA